MRIDAYNQIAQLYQTGKSIRTNKANSTASVRDEVQISQTARDYQIAKQLQGLQMLGKIRWHS